jgi:hypothetical protein
MFNQQVLFAYSRGLLDGKFIGSLIKKGFSVNMMLFDGEGELGKDILYFFLISYCESVECLCDGIDIILNSGFQFKNKNNYWYLLLVALSKFGHCKSAERDRLIKTILRMMNYGMKVEDVCIYYDNVTNANKCVVLIDKLTNEYEKCQFSSLIFNLGVTFENLFKQEDLMFDTGVIIRGKPSFNVEMLCIVKDKCCVLHDLIVGDEVYYKIAKFDEHELLK